MRSIDVRTFIPLERVVISAVAQAHAHHIQIKSGAYITVGYGRKSPRILTVTEIEIERGSVINLTENRALTVIETLGRTLLY